MNVDAPRGANGTQIERIGEGYHNCLWTTEKAFDCVKDALERACKSLRNREPQQVEQMKLLQWTKVVTKNVANDMLERDRQICLVSLQELVEKMQLDELVYYPLTRERLEHQPEAILLHQDACTRLADMISRLPQRQAYAILNRFVGEQCYRVTVASGIFPSEKAATVAVSRGIKALKEMAWKHQLKASDFHVDDFRGVLTNTLATLNIAVPPQRSSERQTNE